MFDSSSDDRARLPPPRQILGGGGACCYVGRVPDPDARSPDDPLPNELPKEFLAESESTREPEQQAGAPAATPFDHPLALPALLAALAVWFFYDAFISQDEAMLENLTFNRSGFAVLALATTWFGYKGWKEMREIRAARTRAQAESNGRPLPLA